MSLSLAQTQTAFARLCTDTALRDRFTIAPQAVAPALGLDADDAQELAHFSSRQIQQFARSLHAKRLGDLCKALSLTHAALGQIRFQKYFSDYVERPVNTGERDVPRDALNFVLFLEQELHAVADWPENAGTAVRYEAACLRAAVPQACVRMRFFRRFEPAPNAPPVVAVWFRATQRSRLHHWVISLPQLF